ncbi:MAG: Type 2A phosphatase-associated protein 42 [Ramalina farinacea]|uniref:Type 2A phosphatase-associated protein 42 n=1 Tax=Ramalina farinacea TaxID=258253 RepID=A0AA43QHA0_9LECA|nr:Type 2A phosphatase-associated protein 42 [Ramalina farinacea]
MDDHQEASFSSLFATAKSKRSNLEAFASATDPLYQENVRSAIEALEQCRKLADRISLFSPNELLEDISSNDLQYLSIDYYQADIILKQTTLDRKHLLRQAQTFQENFIQLLDTYRILSKSNSKLYERYTEDRDNFSLLLSNDAAARRDTKITRFKEEKQLKQKLEVCPTQLSYILSEETTQPDMKSQHLSQNPTALDQDDSALRDLHLAEIQLNTHHAFQSLDMISQELKILASMPPTPPPGPEEQEADYRQRNGLRGGREDYSDRLDPSLSDLYRGGKAGPILNKDGKPLQPFTA